MAGKISTLVLKVDLECHLCYKKIRKTLCKLQDRENIKTISYDEKNNTVTISGPFDPQKLSKKLRCKACKVIKDIQEVKEKPKDPPKDSKPAAPAPPEKEKPKPAKSEPEPEPKPKPKADPPPKAAEPAPKPKPDPPAAKPDPPKAEPAPPKVEPDPPKPPPVVSQGLSYPPVWPVCCGVPYYEGHYGGHRCCSCGRVYGWVAGGPPMAYGGPPHEAYKPYHFFCEEDPSTCTIM